MAGRSQVEALLIGIEKKGGKEKAKLRSEECLAKSRCDKRRDASR